jgi:hypothetical protein
VILIDHIPGNPLEHFTPRNFGLSDSAEAFVFTIRLVGWPHLLAESVRIRIRLAPASSERRVDRRHQPAAVGEPGTDIAGRAGGQAAPEE